MEAAPSPVGVATASPAPPPEWPKERQWTAPPASPPIALPSAMPPVWTPPAQAATALLLCLALGLLAWHALASHRRACRPALLEEGAAADLRIDLNRADHAQLLQLPGVGDSLARRIEDYRREHHGFRQLEDLRPVGGIGPALLDRLRPLVFIGPYESGEDEPAAAPRKESQVVLPGKRKAGAKGLVHMNEATAAELRTLPGIGPKLAERILDARARQPFRSVDDLRRVSGIGPKTLERLRPLVTVGDAAPNGKASGGRQPPVPHQQGADAPRSPGKPTGG
jgi:competence protein ComEA